MAKPDLCCTQPSSQGQAGSGLQAGLLQRTLCLPGRLLGSTERPSIAAPGDPAPPSYPPMATVTPPRRLGPQLTAGRTRPTTPKNHRARLVRVGGPVSLRFCRTPPEECWDV